MPASGQEIVPRFYLHEALAFVPRRSRLLERFKAAYWRGFWV